VNHKTKKIFTLGIWEDNAIYRQILGICSALAVTNLMLNAFVMSLGLIFVTAFSELTVSVLRQYTPKHIRMMVQTLIISAYVIMVDLFLKAFFPSISEALGPYVGLIITNCIIMGRCESFAQKNTPVYAFADGIASGMGYGIVLMLIAFVRELLGFGSIFGINILGDSWVSWTLMIMPPGAFFMLAIVVWVSKNLFPDKSDKKGGAKA
jgi:Na+-transporting NADH:ubiquinone oxidoreductase subunit D